MLWGAGTALGEVPPYALSYHAAKAGKRSAEVEAMLGTSAEGGRQAGEWYSPCHRRRHEACIARWQVQTVNANTQAFAPAAVLLQGVRWRHLSAE